MSLGNPIVRQDRQNRFHGIYNLSILVFYKFLEPFKLLQVAEKRLLLATIPPHIFHVLLTRKLAG
jgi:hypothetical protein